MRPLPLNLTRSPTALGSELCVEDVYVRLYNENPQWTLPAPKRFAERALEEAMAASDAVCPSRSPCWLMTLCAL